MRPLLQQQARAICKLADSKLAHGRQNNDVGAEELPDDADEQAAWIGCPLLQEHVSGCGQQWALVAALQAQEQGILT